MKREFPFVEDGVVFEVVADSFNMDMIDVRYNYYLKREDRNADNFRDYLVKEKSNLVYKDTNIKKVIFKEKKYVSQEARN